MVLPVRYTAQPGILDQRLLGNFIHFETSGLDFVMTAMFVVIFMDQWLKQKHHISQWVGLGASMVCLLLIQLVF